MAFFATLGQTFADATTHGANALAHKIDALVEHLDGTSRLTARGLKNDLDEGTAHAFGIAAGFFPAVLMLSLSQHPGLLPVLVYALVDATVMFGSRNINSAIMAAKYDEENKSSLVPKVS